MPERPPEDDIAICTAYFEVLVAQVVHAKDLAGMFMRVSRLKDPRNWVNVVNMFSSRRQRVPELVEFVQARFLRAPTRVDAHTHTHNPFDDLDAHYLATLAFAMHAQGGASKDFFVAVAARAAAIKDIPAADYENLQVALSTAGVDMPAGVNKVAEAA